MEISYKISIPPPVFSARRANGGNSIAEFHYLTLDKGFKHFYIYKPCQEVKLPMPFG